MPRFGFLFSCLDQLPTCSLSAHGELLKCISDLVSHRLKPFHGSSKPWGLVQTLHSSTMRPSADHYAPLTHHITALLAPMNMPWLLLQPEDPPHLGKAQPCTEPPLRSYATTTQTLILGHPSSTQLLMYFNKLLTQGLAHSRQLLLEGREGLLLSFYIFYKA